MPVDILAVSARALGFVALFQAGGIVLFLALHRHELARTAPALRRLGTLAAVLAAVLLTAEYLLQAARMSGELAGALDPTLLGLLLHSGASVTFSWQLLGLVLVILALRSRRAEDSLIGVTGVVILLAAFTFVGHTAGSPQRWLLSLLLLVHLSVVTFWFGALPPLHVISSGETSEDAARIVADFSARAVWLVPGLFLAGLLLAVALLPNVAALRSAYGELLMAKVVGFCALLVLAASNRWRFGPALRSGGPAAGRRFRQALAAEYLIIVGVVCVTAVMTTFYSP
ncbi:MAG: CopD family protein [Gammaproteobacteria bacterium]|nr:CopD family protein [Gammaproteobacteria bacterium]